MEEMIMCRVAQGEKKMKIQNNDFLFSKNYIIIIIYIVGYDLIIWRL